MLYERLCLPFESRLYQHLKARYWDIKEFGRLFDHARAIALQMGLWCADFYWSFAFSERAHKKLEQKYEQEQCKAKENTSREKLDREIKLLEEAQQDIDGHDFGTPTFTGSDLSTKVATLDQYLRLHFERPSNARCLVFVQEKHTARLLKAVFDRTGGPNLRPGELVGSGSGTFDGVRCSFRQQLSTLIKFKKGDINCVVSFQKHCSKLRTTGAYFGQFATSVAEEGLDVPECNLVVRYVLKAVYTFGLPFDSSAASICAGR